jgi:DNA-directed RNA polymerase III subunit RPC3
MHLRDDEDLSSGLVLDSLKKPSNISLLNDYIGMLLSADSPTPAGRAVSFVSLTGSKVQVEFEIVCRRLRRLVLEAVTRERHGDDGVRILRLLLNTGKMDEKQVSIHFISVTSTKQFLIYSHTTDFESRHDVSKRCTAFIIGHVCRILD